MSIPVYLETVYNLPPSLTFDRKGKSTAICGFCRNSITKKDFKDQRIAAHQIPPNSLSSWFKQIAAFFSPPKVGSYPLIHLVHKDCSEPWRTTKGDEVFCITCKNPLMNEPPLETPPTLQPVFSVFAKKMSSTPACKIALYGTAALSTLIWPDFVGLTTNQRLLLSVAGISAFGISSIAPALLADNRARLYTIVAAAGAMAGGILLGHNELASVVRIVFPPVFMRMGLNCARITHALTHPDNRFWPTALATAGVFALFAGATYTVT